MRNCFGMPVPAVAEPEVRGPPETILRGRTGRTRLGLQCVEGPVKGRCKPSIASKG